MDRPGKIKHYDTKRHSTSAVRNIKRQKHHLYGWFHGWVHHQSFFSQSQGWQINLAINQMQFSLFNGEWNHNWKIVNDLYSLCKEMQCRYGINSGQWRMFNRDFIVTALCTFNWSPAYFRLNSDFHGGVMVRVAFFYINNCNI